MYSEAEAYLLLPLLATYPHEYSTWEQFWEYIVCTCKKGIPPPLFFGVCVGGYGPITLFEHLSMHKILI